MLSLTSPDKCWSMNFQINRSYPQTLTILNLIKRIVLSRVWPLGSRTSKLQRRPRGCILRLSIVTLLNLSLRVIMVLHLRSPNPLFSVRWQVKKQWRNLDQSKPKRLDMTGWRHSSNSTQVSFWSHKDLPLLGCQSSNPSSRGPLERWEHTTSQAGTLIRYHHRSRRCRSTNWKSEAYP